MNSVFDAIGGHWVHFPSSYSSPGISHLCGTNGWIWRAVPQFTASFIRLGGPTYEGGVPNSAARSINDLMLAKIASESENRVPIGLAMHAS